MPTVPDNVTSRRHEASFFRNGPLRPSKSQAVFATWNVEGLTDTKIIELQIHNGSELVFFASRKLTGNILTTMSRTRDFYLSIPAMTPILRLRVRVLVFWSLLSSEEVSSDLHRPRQEWQPSNCEPKEAKFLSLQRMLHIAGDHLKNALISTVTLGSSLLGNHATVSRSFWGTSILDYTNDTQGKKT